MGLDPKSMGPNLSCGQPAGVLQNVSDVTVEEEHRRVFLLYRWPLSKRQL